jgi:predicted site-specific integrase-resolvase
MHHGENEIYICIREATKISGIGIQTIRKLCDTGKIKCFKTLSGQRKINKSSLERLYGINDFDKNNYNPKQNYIYVRVSSKKQLDDLSRQTLYIQSSDPKYITYNVISDIASGINFKRKGLQTILDSAMQGNIGEVVVANKDRFSRGAFDLIQFIIERSGGKITILDHEETRTTEQELAEELLSIVHVYSCKQMGKRRYKRTITTIQES